MMIHCKAERIVRSFVCLICQVETEKESEKVLLDCSLLWQGKYLLS